MALLALVENEPSSVVNFGQSTQLASLPLLSLLVYRCWRSSFRSHTKLRMGYTTVSVFVDYYCSHKIHSQNCNDDHFRDSLQRLDYRLPHVAKGLRGLELVSYLLHANRPKVWQKVSSRTGSTSGISIRYWRKLAVSCEYWAQHFY